MRQSWLRQRADRERGVGISSFMVVMKSLSLMEWTTLWVNHGARDGARVCTSPGMDGDVDDVAGATDGAGRRRPC